MLKGWRKDKKGGSVQIWEFGPRYLPQSSDAPLNLERLNADFSENLKN